MFLLWSAAQCLQQCPVLVSVGWWDTLSSLPQLPRWQQEAIKPAWQMKMLHLYRAIGIIAQWPHQNTIKTNFIATFKYQNILCVFIDNDKDIRVNNSSAQALSYETSISKICRSSKSAEACSCQAEKKVRIFCTVVNWMWKEMKAEILVGSGG